MGAQLDHPTLTADDQPHLPGPTYLMATLDLQNISKSFGATEVLHDISLAIKDREFVVFVGPSGCGKSTLLRIIAGLEEASQGQIIIDGQDVSREHPIERGISMVFQSYALYPHLTVFENIAFPLRVQKLPEDQITEMVHRASDILQLTERQQNKPGQLSGGQRQRVAIGRSIVRDPKIFLFDEPLSNLDAALRGDMRVELAQLHKQLNATMVYVTHDQVEAMTMADRIVVLRDGYVEQFGTPMELYHHPQTKFVAGFIGQPNMNFVNVVVVEADAAGIKVTLPSGADVTLPIDGSSLSKGDRIEMGLRPDDLIMDQNGGLPMKVDVLERLGNTSITYGSIEGGSRLCAALDGTAIIQEDGIVNLTFDPASAHAFDAKGRGLRRQNAPTLTA